MEKIPTWQMVVAAALQADDSRWLMHKRPDEKHHGGLWEFPGGKVETGENPAFALARELQEELGIVVDPADCIAETFAHETMAQVSNPIVILLYTLRNWTEEPVALEGGEVGWFTEAQALALDKPPLDIVLSRKLFEKE